MGPKSVFSHGNTATRGVCILSKPTLSFDIIKMDVHDAGRYIILDLKVHGCIFTLLCVYGPNVDDPMFYRSFVPLLSNFQCDNIITLGDFNFVFNLGWTSKMVMHVLISMPEMSVLKK